LRAAVERAAGRGELHAVAAAIEQRQAGLPLQLAHGREHRRMRAMQRGRRGLEAARPDHRVEALQVVQGEFAHRGSHYSLCPNFVMDRCRRGN
jgi:hypothetical protein